MKRISLVLMLLLCFSVVAVQAQSYGPAFSVRFGSSDPAQCVAGIGMIFFNTNTNILKVCSATNTWSASGFTFPAPGSAGLCWVSTGASTYAWGSCSGAASAAFSAITGSTNTTAAMVVGTGASIDVAGTGSINATKINGTALSGLATGIVKNTTTTGVPSIAVAGDFPTLNQNTTGTAAAWTTSRNLAGNAVNGTADVAFANKFIVQGTVDAGLSGAQFMGALGTGIVKNTTTTGVFSIAIAGDFPTLNQSTTGSAATLTTPRSIYGNNFDGSAALSQIIASTFGGTGNGFTKFSGPLTAEKTFTLPNASATILTDNAAVTGAQGGLNANASAFTGVLREASGTASASELSGAVTTSASNVTAMGKIDVTDANVFCAAAGANTTTYTCSLSPAITGYVTGTHYRFKADVANTAASTINFNAQGAKTIKKAVGGITTDVVANDLRAGQWVDMVYDGTNMQMQSTLGNAASGSGTINAATQYSFPYYSASGSASTLDGVAGPTANGFYTVGYNVTGGVALAPTAVLSGVPVNAQTGTSYTLLYSDRNSYLSFSNAGAITVTLPQAGTTGFTSNYSFVACDIGVGTATITPTTSNISYSSGTAYTAAQTTMALTTGQCAFIYSDNTNYFAFQIKGGAGGGVSSLTGAGIITNSGSTGAVTLTYSGTSGGIPYFSSASALSSSAALTVNVLTKGGGAGAAPANSLATDNGTSLTYTGTGGYVGPSLTTNGASAGFAQLGQGTSNAAGTTAVTIQAPTSVTSYRLTLPGANPTNNNSALLFSNASPSVGSFAKMPQTAVTTTSYTNATTTFSTVTGTNTLQFSVEASTNYVGACYILWQGSAGTTGPKFQFTGPASPTAVAATATSNVTATTFSTASATAFSSSMANTGTITTATNFPATINFSVVNGVNAGTVILQAAANGTGTLTIQPGSYCTMQ